MASGPITFGGLHQIWCAQLGLHFVRGSIWLSISVSQRELRAGWGMPFGMSKLNMHFSLHGRSKVLILDSLMPDSIHVPNLCLALSRCLGGRKPKDALHIVQAVDIRFEANLQMQLGLAPVSLYHEQNVWSPRNTARVSCPTYRRKGKVLEDLSVLPIQTQLALCLKVLYSRRLDWESRYTMAVTAGAPVSLPIQTSTQL